jgi:hypothetical protein
LTGDAKVDLKVILTHSATCVAQSSCPQATVKQTPKWTVPTRPVSARGGPAWAVGSLCRRPGGEVVQSHEVPLHQSDAPRLVEIGAHGAVHASATVA